MNLVTGLLALSMLFYFSALLSRRNRRRYERERRVNLRHSASLASSASSNSRQLDDLYVMMVEQAWRDRERGIERDDLERDMELLVKMRREEIEKELVDNSLLESTLTYRGEIPHDNLQHTRC